ncbi:MAG TPA: glycosyltransferase family 1 protein [Ktedonobacterales bacterium]
MSASTTRRSMVSGQLSGADIALGFPATGLTIRDSGAIQKARNLTHAATIRLGGRLINIVASMTALGVKRPAHVQAPNAVVQSDQPSAQLPAIHARRGRARTWEDGTDTKAVLPDDLREPPQRTKRRQVAAFFGGVVALAVIVAACVAFLPAGVEIAALLVFAAIVWLVAIWPRLALFVFVLLLPLHNFLMAVLYHATGDATFIKVIQPWKEVVLAVALLRVGIPALLAWMRTRRLRLVMLDVLVLLFAGICLVSVAIPSDAVSLAGRMLGFRQLALPFAVYFLGRLAVPTRRELRWLVGLFAAIALLNAVGAIGERLFWGGNLFAAIDFGGYNAAFFGFTSANNLPYNMGTTFFTGTPSWLPRAGSFVMNPLDLATLMTISLPIVLAALPFFTAYWRWLGRVLLSAAALLGSVGIYLAFSRTNMVVFLLEIVLLVLLIGIRRQWAGALLVGLGYLIGASLFQQTAIYVSGGRDPGERIARGIQGMLPSGSYTVLDVVVPTITLIAMAGVVAAIIGLIRAMREHRRRSLAAYSVAGALAIAVVAACLLAPPLVEANKTGILAPLVGGITPITNAASSDNTSTLGHLESYLVMVPFIIHHPLGYGIGSAGFVGVRQGTGLGTESAYLPVGAQLGFLGLFLYVAIFLTILFALWKVSRARLDRLTRAVFVGALAAWVFMLIDGVLTEVTLNFFAFYVMLWLTGSAVSLTRWARVTWDDTHQRYQAVRPLRVAMDVQCLYTARTGVRTYVTKLLEEFAWADLPHTVVPISGPKGLPRTNVVFRMIDQVLNLLWLHLLLPLRLLLGGYDVLFSPEYLTPVWCPVPNAVTFHDSAFLRRPKDYNRLWQLVFRNVNLPAIRRADAIIVPSRFAMNEAVHYAKFSPDKVCVTHLGGPQPGSMHVSDEAASGFLERFGLERGSYFVHVGVLERRKNLPMLIEAFHELTLRGLAESFKLVLAGQPGPRPDLNDAPNIRATVERLGLQDRVILPGYLSDDDVHALLINAFAYVLPSKSEGFGIPVLEAFAAGIPVVCSTAGALPEVSGDAALHFDPENGAQLVECLVRLGSDPALQRDLVKAGTERARMFTWEQTARETLAAFEAAVLHASAPAVGVPPLSIESGEMRP